MTNQNTSHPASSRNNMMTYNTSREKLQIPEYGRHIQQMIEFALTIEDREKRNKAARVIVSMMGQLINPQRLDSGDFRQKLWDHLVIISDFRLDVDGPYEKPLPRGERNKPRKGSYPHKHIRFRQYGKVVEDMIAKTIEMEEGEEKNACVRLIANMMKKLYMSWNRDSITDDVIDSHLAMLSEGRLTISGDAPLEATAEPQPVAQQQRTKKKKFQPGGKGNFTGSNSGYNGNYPRNRRRNRNYPNNGSSYID